MGKVSFETGIDSARGIMMGDDPFYIRRYRCKDGRVLHIVQSRPNRSGHVPTEAEAANRKVFGQKYGTGRREQRAKSKEQRTKNKDLK